ncbi:MAG: hypothetical protein WB755_14160, partial [Terriglobales bacterium]
MSEPPIATTTVGLPAAAGSVFGCPAASDGGLDVPTAFCLDGLLTGTGPDFCSGTGATIIVLTDGLTSAGPDDLLTRAISEFGCEGGVTTADGKLLPASLDW